MKSETIEGFRIDLREGVEAFERKGLNVNPEKTKVKASGSIMKDDVSNSNVYLCRVCSLRVKGYLVLCVQCGKCFHSKCAGIKRVTPMSSRNIAGMKCEGNIGGSGAERKVMQ